MGLSFDSQGRKAAKPRIPTDYDPEDPLLSDANRSDSDSETSDINDDSRATEHYTGVEKSKIRPREELKLGPSYRGMPVRRDAYEESNAESHSGSDGSDATSGGAEDSGEEDDGATTSSNHSTLLGKSRNDVSQINGQHAQEGLKASSTAKRRRPRAVDFMNEDMQEKNNHGETTLTDLITDAVDSTASTSNDEISDADVLENGFPEDAEDSSDDAQDSMSSISDEQQSEMDDADQLDRRAELRNIMAEEQTAVVSAISQATQDDVKKGNAVKQQRQSFNSLVSIRMQLQKALVSINSITTTGGEPAQESIPDDAYAAAEQAALRLWTSVDEMRHTLHHAHTGQKPSKKRKRAIESSTPSESLWSEMQKFENEVSKNRAAVLDKWSGKLRASKPQPITNKLKPSTGNQQPLTEVLQDYIATSHHLVQRTQVPRSCAPIQATAKVSHDARIYDDADWYQLLLQELIAQKRGEQQPLVHAAGGAAAASGGDKPMWAVVREAKTRKVVDTKASKGRKLRYNVHERLQNFMASEDRRQWEESAVDRFFGSLLGQARMLEEEEEGGADTDGDGGVDVDPAEEGLRLFRN